MIALSETKTLSGTVGGVSSEGPSLRGLPLTLFLIGDASTD